MSEVLRVGSFWRNLHFLTFYKAILVIFSQNKVKSELKLKAESF